VQMQIYRIVQEALNNICRHSGATKVRMEVGCDSSGDFQLTIADNGREFNPKQEARRDGRGLANMRARASLIDAGISWRKSDTLGTIFTLRKEK
ncbi:MAG TPA: ATP-binding protein, partial [Pyrinomonadaceae bacterium]|nr:ATP-binding protein [Pyrinomonadaceae bacterium]